MDTVLKRYKFNFPFLGLSACLVDLLEPKIHIYLHQTNKSIAESKCAVGARIREKMMSCRNL